MSNERIKNPSTSDNSFAPKRINGYLPPEVKFNGNWLKQDSVSFPHKNIVNLYIAFELDA